MLTVYQYIFFNYLGIYVPDSRFIVFSGGLTQADLIHSCNIRVAMVTTLSPLVATWQFPVLGSIDDFLEFFAGTETVVSVPLKQLCTISVYISHKYIQNWWYILPQSNKVKYHCTHILWDTVHIWLPTESRVPAIIVLFISTDWWLNNRPRYVHPCSEVIGSFFFFCNVEKWYLNSIYQFAILWVLSLGIAMFVVKISSYYLYAFGICRCLKSVKFEKPSVKMTAEIETWHNRIARIQWKKFVHMSRWNIPENIAAAIGN